MPRQLRPAYSTGRSAVHGKKDKHDDHQDVMSIRPSPTRAHVGHRASVQRTTLTPSLVARRTRQLRPAEPAGRSGRNGADRRSPEARVTAADPVCHAPATPKLRSSPLYAGRRPMRETRGPLALRQHVHDLCAPAIHQRLRCRRARSEEIVLGLPAPHPLTFSRAGLSVNGRHRPRRSGRCGLRRVWLSAGSLCLPGRRWSRRAACRSRPSSTRR
jgi:hypothetical protein